MLRNFLMPLFSAAFLVASAAAADAGITVNNSKSNTYRTKPDCVKGGGKWDGKYCWVPATKRKGQQTK